MRIGRNKLENISHALKLVCDAKQKGSYLVVLPECFNSPYGTKYFPEYSEKIPDGETSLALSKAAKDNSVYLIGGSIPEKSGSKYYNTSTVWDPQGNLICKHQKVHLFDINIAGGVKFQESEILSPGDRLSVFNIGPCKVGLGICYDLRFHEMASLYRKQGIDLLVYPGAFNMNTGPLHWELLLRSRAVDNQVFVAAVCGAQDKNADYVAWGHSMLVDPWGKIMLQAEFQEDLLVGEISENKFYDYNLPLIFYDLCCVA
ncbi:hypothetical protein AAG570_009189 [Ranatra chinensis]|uniref:omega-amidase n=1 Tax=Ranatra chinensis TaxID=642074 RepID=A0ABD0YV74_9HEMI